nr:uncharacterized protein CI109_002606 [Kwoniella shandongensis]KAA5528849.1 hypothetical protein CI109_002606 [Kwoniella shandongensis]
MAPTKHAGTATKSKPKQALSTTQTSNVMLSTNKIPIQQKQAQKNGIARSKAGVVKTYGAQSRRTIKNKISVVSMSRARSGMPKSGSLNHSSRNKEMIVGKGRMRSIVVSKKKDITRSGQKGVVKPIRSVIPTSSVPNTKTSTKLKSITKVTVSSSSTTTPTTAGTAPPSASSAGPKPPKKEYMTAGFYCQNTTPSSSQTLVSKVVRAHEAELTAAKKIKKTSRQSDSALPTRTTRGSTRPSTSASASASAAVIVVDRPTFPPLPYDHGHELFFGTEQEFVLPYNIRVEKESGLLDGKKKPAHFQKIRASVFPERPRISAGYTAVCKCSPESRCGEQCMNRIMSYLCGKECPCGDACENRALNKRKSPGYKVVYTGSRGFGIILTEDLKEGEFVMDYRGEVISMDTFMERIHDEYKSQKNFYALEYDQDEVIDAGMKGNDARFINHGCAPNLEVRKYQSLGDGWEEYEVGMWALRDIKKGEELFYDYNFESFGVAAQSDELRTKCCCGAPNCVGFLGRKAGEKSAKELAAVLSARRAEEAKMKAKGKKRKASSGKKVDPPSSSMSSAITTAKALSATPSMISNGSSIAESSTVIRTPSTSSTEIQVNMSSKMVKSAFQQRSNTSASTGKLKRKSEAALVTKINMGSNKKGRKSEPAPVTQQSTSIVDKKSAALHIKRMKEEAVKARNGAPKGWAYVTPGQEVKSATEGTSGGGGGRRPPRDRTSLVL